MRYFIAINLDKKQNNNFAFKKLSIYEYLKVENNQILDDYINIATLNYLRDKPGLLEQNWDNPVFNNSDYCLFIGGSILYRNKIDSKRIAPSPEEVFNILIDSGNDHYNYFKGNYYLLLLDKKLMFINIYSSPMFMHPAFYSITNNQFIFSNSIEAINSYTDLTLDKQGLVEFSLFDHCLFDRTIYNEVKSIQGGTLLEFKNGKVNYILIYDIAKKWYTKQPKSRKESLPAIQKSLKKSISSWSKCAGKFNISLTGGFDGRLNLSFIDKAQYPNLISRNYGMKGSSQINIPNEISKKLGFENGPIYLDDDFEQKMPDLGLKSILLTGGITGFNRAMYPYAYNKMKDFSRSCLLGQCDMIRPLKNNPAGVVFNDFSNSIFFETFENFKGHYNKFATTSFINKSLYTEEIMHNIYNAIKTSYIESYNNLPEKLQFYFFLLKESLMKYWQTEFHLVDIFVDDYVSFGDLDYLELLFDSKYAGIYKGLLAKNQLFRKSPHDLYVDLMSLNNNRLNFIKNDRNIKPGWLKYGKPGWLFAAIMKKYNDISKDKNPNDTFNAEKWFKIFTDTQKANILEEKKEFNIINLKTYLEKENLDSGMYYRFNRMVSIKLWLSKSGII